MPRGQAAELGRRQPAELAIDWTACRGRGLCADLLPELLAEDPWGYPLPRQGQAGGPGGALTAVPDGLVEPARRAVRLCPRLALQLRHTTGTGAEKRTRSHP